MFSQLGPLFRTHLRQAERSDARLDIPHEEKHDQGKKQEAEKPEEDTAALWEDSTQVSIEALRTFLSDFLKSRGEKPQEGPAAVADEGDVYAGLQPQSRPPANPAAARAVKAYTAMASHSFEPPPYVAQTNAPETIDLADLLKADEVRTMYSLIAELDQMSRRGLQTLTIEKADTFLEALVEAVRLEKSRL